MVSFDGVVHHPNRELRATHLLKSIKPEMTYSNFVTEVHTIWWDCFDHVMPLRQKGGMVLSEADFTSVVWYFEYAFVVRLST